MVILIIMTIFYNYYFLNPDNSQDSNSCLDVQILYLQVQYSLHIARCRLLPSNDSSMPPVIDVMFNTESCKQVVPRVGGAVRIHPPWYVNINFALILSLEILRENS